jgi:hypothetical protein
LPLSKNSPTFSLFPKISQICAKISPTNRKQNDSPTASFWQLWVDESSRVVFCSRIWRSTAPIYSETHRAKSTRLAFWRGKSEQRRRKSPYWTRNVRRLKSYGCYVFQVMWIGTFYRGILAINLDQERTAIIILIRAGDDDKLCVTNLKFSMYRDL